MRKLDIIKTVEGDYLYGETFQFTNGEWGFAVRGNAPTISAALAWVMGYAKHSEAMPVEIVSNLVTDEIARNQEFNVYKDGSAWCATTQEFIDLQESPAGFGKYPHDAINDLLNKLVEQPAKVPA